MLGKAALLPLAFVLASCVQRPHVPPVLVVDRVSCDRTLVSNDGAVLKFDPKSPVESNLRLTPEARCIEAEDGSRDYYAAFALPQTNARYTLSVGAAPEDVSLLAPQILLLDDQGTVTRRLTAPQFLFRGNQLTALVQPRPNETRMIVMSDHTLVGQTTSRILQMITTSSWSAVTPRFTIVGQIRTGDENRIDSTFSFVGPMTIGTVPIAPAG